MNPRHRWQRPTRLRIAAPISVLLVEADECLRAPGILPFSTPIRFRGDPIHPAAHTKTPAIGAERCVSPARDSAAFLVNLDLPALAAKRRASVRSLCIGVTG